MTLPDSTALCLSAPDFGDRLAAIPNTGGIYALSASGRVVHLAWSTNLHRRLIRLLMPSQASSLAAKLRDNLDSLSYWVTGSKLETSLIMFALAKQHYPADYLKRLRLRMPWFVVLTNKHAFPYLKVTNHLRAHYSPALGPFLKRDAAQYYEAELSGLFQLRRCTDLLVPSLDHPGCIYGEMNQCLRPCQRAVTASEYFTEVLRASDFLSSNGKSAIASLITARARAAEQTDFEQAAFLHKRIEKIKTAAAARDDAVSLIETFNGVALTRSSVPRAYRLWPMVRGFWQDPVTVEVSLQDSHQKSLDSTLREKLTSACNSDRSPGGDPLEDLALFSRWYYSSWRDGSWFPFRTLQDLNYRKLVREIANLVKSEPAPSAAS